MKIKRAGVGLKVSKAGTAKKEREKETTLQGTGFKFVCWKLAKRAETHKKKGRQPPMGGGKAGQRRGVNKPDHNPDDEGRKPKKKGIQAACRGRKSEERKKKKNRDPEEGK